MQEEGLEPARQRHALNHRVFAAGVEALGLSLLVDEEFRLPQLNAVSFPDSVDDAAVRATLLDDYNLEIGAGLGSLAGKVWRVGLMGFSSHKKNVLFCLSAIAFALSGSGSPADADKAVTVAQSIYSAK